MVKAIVTGAAGRMGGRIIEIISGSAGIEVVAAVERGGHPLIGKNIAGYGAIGSPEIRLCDSLESCIDQGDVVIDFTHREATEATLRTAVAHGKAIVIGTTGHTPEEGAVIRELGAQTRCVFAPNMSVGVNVMFKLLEYVTGIMGDDFDIEIVEAHHNLKKDAPSGTAVKMAEVIAAELGRRMEEVGVYGRKGIVGERTKQEIGVHAVRAGDIVGEHTVIFGGVGERIEVTHRAHSRDNFVKGAIRAACWVVDRPKGLYDMQDVLGLR